MNFRAVAYGKHINNVPTFHGSCCLAVFLQPINSRLVTGDQAQKVFFGHFFRSHCNA